VTVGSMCLYYISEFFGFLEVVTDFLLVFFVLTLSIDELQLPPACLILLVLPNDSFRSWGLFLLKLTIL
jgi:hypothetical protein